MSIFRPIEELKRDPTRFIESSPQSGPIRRENVGERPCEVKAQPSQLVLISEPYLFEKQQDPPQSAGSALPDEL
jgi:hypothetical protein